ncbi:MAG: BREX-1 system phosphatase PglZ type A [Aeromonas sp.]
MDISQLQTGLNKKFEQSRIVFWHDPEQSFLSYLDDSAQELAAGLHYGQQGVTVLNMAHESQLEIHMRIELEAPETAFLLYWPSAEPAPADDWLLALRRYSTTFYADAASLLLNELGLANMALREYIAARTAFFSSKVRTQSLKRKLDGRSGMEDPLSLDLKMISVVLGCHANLSAIIQELATDLLPDGEDNLGKLDKFGLLPSLWQQLEQDYGYRCDENSAPSLREFVRRLFASEAYELLQVTQHDQRPLWLQQQRLATPSGRANAMALLASWRDSTTQREVFCALSALVAEQLELSSRLERLTQHELLDWRDVVSFEVVEQAFIREMRLSLEKGELTLADLTIEPLIAQRQAAFWPHMAAKYALMYQALQQAASLFTLRRRYPDNFSHYTSAKALYQAYESELFQFDQAYRRFIAAQQQLQAQGVEAFAQCSEQIEALYVNWYIYHLALAWDRCLEQDKLMQRWQLGLPKQSDFYQQVIEQRFEHSTIKRQVVIISDALRYEVAHELQEIINQEKRFKATLTSQVGVLPSYTQLGMAALLPHRAIDFSANAETVLVDGHSSAGLDNRHAILARHGGMAISAKSLHSWTQAQAVEAVGSARVIYIYHDTIDAIGDKAATELDTCGAVCQAIEELQSLIKKVLNGLKVSRVLITADHGFLYRHSAPDASVKASQEQLAQDALVAKKRYVLGRQLPSNDNVWHGRIGDNLAGGSDMAFWLSKGASRFNFIGGARFVHGGAMLQEICVPILDVQALSTTKQAQHEKAKVNTVPLHQPIKLVNAIDKIKFMQTEAVGERHKARTVSFSVCDAAEQPVSAVEKVTFAATAEQPEQRQQDVRIKLLGSNFDRKAQYLLILQDDEDSIELARYAVTIDLAIQNEFGF